MFIVADREFETLPPAVRFAVHLGRALLTREDTDQILRIETNSAGTIVAHVTHPVMAQSLTEITEKHRITGIPVQTLLRESRDERPLLRLVANQAKRFSSMPVFIEDSELRVIKA